MRSESSKGLGSAKDFAYPRGLSARNLARSFLASLHGRESFIGFLVNHAGRCSPCLVVSAASKALRILVCGTGPGGGGKKSGPKSPHPEKLAPLPGKQLRELHRIHEYLSRLGIRTPARGNEFGDAGVKRWPRRMYWWQNAGTMRTPRLAVLLLASSAAPLWPASAAAQETLRYKIVSNETVAGSEVDKFS